MTPEANHQTPAPEATPADRARGDYLIDILSRAPSEEEIAAQQAKVIPLPKDVFPDTMLLSSEPI